jgi:hypothetical protein
VCFIAHPGFYIFPFQAQGGKIRCLTLERGDADPGYLSRIPDPGKCGPVFEEFYNFLPKNLSLSSQIWVWDPEKTY